MTPHVDTRSDPVRGVSSRTQHLRDMPLEPWLEVGDPLTEAVVDTFRERRLPLADPVPVIRRLAAEGDAACRDFLADVETPASESEYERMLVGAAMAYRHFPQLIVALTHGGLMTTFASAEAAYILARTGRFARDVPRRLLESAALFFGVLDVDALRPGGTAWETCVRVRLMHTMIRQQLIKTDAWPMAGKPISALHTATGPAFFGAMMLRRLDALGARMTTAEADGFYLLWRHVTRLLGVPADLLGDNTEEQDALDERILELAFTPDHNSRDLARVLIEGLDGMPGANRAPRAVHETLARFMLGDDKATAMGLPPYTPVRRAVVALAPGLKVYGWAQRMPLVGNRLERFGRRYLNSLVQHGL